MGGLFDKILDDETTRDKVKEIVLEELEQDEEFRAKLRRAIFK